MTDELNKDWRKEMDEQEKKWAEQEAEYERSLKSLNRWKVAANCVEMVGITLVTLAVCFGAFELGRRLELRAEKQRQKTCVVESAKVQAAGLPRIVPDDIFKGYAMAIGAEVPGITKDSGLTPSPR